MSYFYVSKDSTSVGPIGPIGPVGPTGPNAVFDFSSIPATSYAFANTLPLAIIASETPIAFDATSDTIRFSSNQITFYKTGLFKVKLTIPILYDTSKGPSYIQINAQHGNTAVFSEDIHITQTPTNISNKVIPLIEYYMCMLNITQSNTTIGFAISCPNSAHAIIGEISIISLDNFI